MNVVIKELKYKIFPIAAKVKRYQEWVDSYRQNRQFENNQRQFYMELDQKEERCDDDCLWLKNRNSFWGTWSQSADHKKDAKWLQKLQTDVNAKKQEKIEITT